MISQAVSATVEYSFHPLAEQWPLMDGPEFEALIEDIRIRGLMTKIAVDADERILDGRNRYRACLAAGVAPEFEVVPYSSATEVEEFILSQNLHRRHLDADALARVMQSMRDAGKSLREIEKATGISRSTVQRKTKVADVMLDSPLPVPDETFRTSGGRGTALTVYSPSKVPGQLAEDESFETADHAVAKVNFGEHANEDEPKPAAKRMSPLTPEEKKELVDVFRSAKPLNRVLKKIGITKSDAFGTVQKDLEAISRRMNCDWNTGPLYKAVKAFSMPEKMRLIYDYFLLRDRPGGVGRFNDVCDILDLPRATTLELTTAMDNSVAESNLEINLRPLIDELDKVERAVAVALRDSDMLPPKACEHLLAFHESLCHKRSSLKSWETRVTLAG